MDGCALPRIRSDVPGPRSRAWIARLAEHECPAITARRERRARQVHGADPIVWKEARGANVIDVDGNRFVDLSAAFAVALVGHRNPEILRAVRDQEECLIHAMGDAFPDETRIRLMEALARRAPPGLEVCILGLSGSDAVDAAIKTAYLATARPGVLAFDGAYHGLALGVLPLQAYQPRFSLPFASITHPAVVHLPWGCPLDMVEKAVEEHNIGLVMIEPIQGRGGIRVPDAGWFQGVARAARAGGALVCHDEIQSGLGRTGAWWAGSAMEVVPDLLCVGKALGGGFPLSACLGTREIMDAWGPSSGEAIHTQTFLGHPVGCAAGLAVLEWLERRDAPGMAARVERTIRRRFSAFRVRGRGAMLALEVPGHAYRMAQGLLRRGYIVLPAGRDDDAIGLTPPLVITDEQIDAFASAFERVYEEIHP